jgi:hypothetical protein
MSDTLERRKLLFKGPIVPLTSLSKINARIKTDFENITLMKLGKLQNKKINNSTFACLCFIKVDSSTINDDLSKEIINNLMQFNVYIQE